MIDCTIELSDKINPFSLKLFYHIILSQQLERYESKQEFLHISSIIDHIS